MPEITKEYYKNFITRNRTELLIEEMLGHLSQYLSHSRKRTIQKIYDALIIISGQLASLKHEESIGVIDGDTVNLKKNRIHQSLVETINTLPAYYFGYLNGDKKEASKNTPDLRDKVIAFHQENNFQYDAFLSFSSKDLEEAKRICDELRGYGLSIFLSDEALKSSAGLSFNEKIELALNNSQHFILLSSVNSMASEWVKIEYETFFNEFHIKNKEQRRFIILKGAEFDLDTVPKIYRRLQFANKPKGVLTTFVKDRNLEARQEKEEEDQKGEAERAKRAAQTKEKIEAAKRQVEQERLQELALKEIQEKKAAEKNIARKAWFQRNRNTIGKWMLLFLFLILGLIFIPPLLENSEENDISLLDSITEENQDSLKAEKNYQKLLKEAGDYFDKKDFANAKQKYQEAIIAIDTFNIDSRKAINGEAAAKKEIKKITDKQSTKEKEDNYEKWKNKGDDAYKKENYTSAKEFYETAQEYLEQQEIQQKIKDCKAKIKVLEQQAANEKKLKSSKPSLPSIIQALEKNMINIPSGTFTIGCTSEQENCSKYEKPTRQVNISKFKMNKYEVTQEEWRAVMGKDPSDLKFKGCNKCPVENVSWNDIQDFLKKLNKITQKDYRLPNEAEWEYAARGGEKYQFSGSNDIKKIAWYLDNAENKTHPVGGKKENGFGLYDMSGNVWEWCEDKWHDNYEGAPSDGSAWIENGTSSRVIRGGSWNDPPQYCRVAYRLNSPPSFRAYSLGFRVVLSSFSSGG